MRKVNLSMKEQERYEIIKSLVDHHGNKKRAAVKLGCTVRTVIALFKSIKSKGK